MQENSVESRREAVVARLTSAKDIYEQCLRDVTPEAGNKGSEWSIADLLRHVNTDQYRNRVKRLLDEDNPSLGAYDPKAVWRQITETSLGKIDEALSLAITVTPDQLARAGERGGRPHTVIDALEAWTGHFEEHGSQLRDEIRPRESLPKV